MGRKKKENTRKFSLSSEQKMFFGVEENDPVFNDFFLLINVMLFERRKEFIGQGMRWFDMKRFGIDVLHLFQDGSVGTLEFEDPRWVFQIPQSAIDVGGLEPNPR